MDRFAVMEVVICPVILVKNSKLQLGINYPTRLCVLDKENNIVIDVIHGVKYDYIDTINGKFWIDGGKKYGNNKRVGLFGSSCFIGKPLEEQTKNNINQIIFNLINKVDYLDGNKVFSNEEYVNIINEESSVVGESKKVKKIGKKQK